jgi:hypothetical protein
VGLMPIELLRAGTSAKFVEHDLLNRMGIQVARALVAHKLHDRRRVRLRGAATARQLRALDEDGIIVIENFLPGERLSRLKEEALRLVRDGTGRVHRHGPTRVIHRSFGGLDDGLELSRFFEDPVLLDLFDSGERAFAGLDRRLRAVEEVIQGEGSEKDPETELHTDIFFPTHKGWLYLDDVRAENAPLVYVKGSHRMGRERLSYEYGYSCSKDRRSRRITEDEFERRGLVESVLEVPANTLVVANVCGYHRRQRGVAGKTRTAIIMSCRRNPFLPPVAETIMTAVRGATLQRSGG